MGPQLNSEAYIKHYYAHTSILISRPNLSSSITHSKLPNKSDLYLHLCPIWNSISITLSKAQSEHNKNPQIKGSKSIKSSPSQNSHTQFNQAQWKAFFNKICQAQDTKMPQCFSRITLKKYSKLICWPPQSFQIKILNCRFFKKKKKFTPKFFKIETNPSLENFTKVLQPFEYHDHTPQPW